MKHQKKCEWCGNVFEYKFPCKAHRFCSHACANAATKTVRQPEKIVAYTCANCGNQFSMKSHVASHREKIGQPPRFCSVSCCSEYAARHAIRHTCPCCGVEFTGRASKKYCSSKCAALVKSTPGSVWSESGVHDKAARAAYMRQYTEAHREQHNARAREWWANHPGLKAAQRISRRGSGRLSVAQIAEVYERDRHMCAVCCSTENLQVDHIVPVSRGGRSVMSNMQILCATCNQSKGAKDFFLWVEETYGVDLSELRNG